jgi:hypothetical protein
VIAVETGKELFNRKRKVYLQIGQG